MLKKKYSDNNQSCQVTFELPADVNTQTACVCGEFSAWDTNAHPMKRRKDGSFTLTLSLDAERQYRFRYWLNGERWGNDPTVDGYATNPFGSKDSLVQT